MMHQSDTGTCTGTATTSGNNYYHRCKKCGYELFMCICWYDLMDKLNRIIAIKAKLDVYKYIIKNSVWINIVNFIRRTPTSISGCKGIALLKRIDKI